MTEQKQIDRTKNKESRSYSKENEPPSWSELGSKMSDNNSVLKIAGSSGLILLGVAISPISSASLGIFGFVGILSYLNKLTTFESVAIGGLTGLISALFSSIFLSIITLGGFTIPFILIGMLIAFIANYIGKKLN